LRFSPPLRDAKESDLIIFCDEQTNAKVAFGLVSTAIARRENATHATVARGSRIYDLFNGASQTRPGSRKTESSAAEARRGETMVMTNVWHACDCHARS
jgi:hypothetical protein